MTGLRGLRRPRRTIGAAARARRPLVGLAAAAAATALTVGFAAQGRVMLHDCVSAGGPLGPLGLRLSVLQDAADCPEGSYALGAVSRGGVVLLSVALPVLALYVLLTACGVGLSALLVRVVRQARALVSGALPRFRSVAPRALVRPGAGLVPSSRPVLPAVRVLVGSIARRGPPATA
jgi:hypothetical protein